MMTSDCTADVSGLKQYINLVNDSTMYTPKKP